MIHARGEGVDKGMLIRRHWHAKIGASGKVAGCSDDAIAISARTGLKRCLKNNDWAAAKLTSKLLKT